MRSRRSATTPRNWFRSFETWTASSKAEYLDLDKSWHILHTLIAGSPDVTDAPEAMLLSGEDVGPPGGYGPARLIEPASVEAFAQVLEPLDVDALKSRVDLQQLREAGVTFAPLRHRSRSSQRWG